MSAFFHGVVKNFYNEHWLRTNHNARKKYKPKRQNNVGFK